MLAFAASPASGPRVMSPTLSPGEEELSYINRGTPGSFVLSDGYCV